jgi:hypothetical protein
MNAEELTNSLEGRWNNRTETGIARCPVPSHQDRHPSFSIAQKNGIVVFVCRSLGCSQSEVIEALRERGLWAAASPAQRAPAVDWAAVLTIAAPKVPSCCLRGPESGAPTCEHWRAFDADMAIARLHTNLREAADEVVVLFKSARIELTEAELRSELNLAVNLGGGAIVPFHMTPDIVEKMIAVTAAEVLGYAARAA